VILAGVDSNGLSPDQLRDLALQLEKHAHYLNRLRQRFVDPGFRDDDQLFATAKTAAAAVERLTFLSWELQRKASARMRRSRRY
jgi:hypothetical protein